MTEKQVIKYLSLLDRRGAIMGHSGYDWKPEYSRELEQIEKELTVLRIKADEECEGYKQNVTGSGTAMPVMLPLTKESKETGLSYGFLKGLIADGKISYVMAGKKILINHESLVQYLERGEVSA